MLQKELLKKILPGLIPLFIFIAADALWGTRIGLYVALATGIIQLIYFYVKDRKIDRFILFDTILILALGAVSIISDNSLFFKLKPALIEAILAILLVFSLFSRHNILLAMSKRYMQEGMEIKQSQILILRKQMGAMLMLLLVHIALVVYAAFLLSEAAWGFISGPLFYILIGIWFLGTLAYTRIRQSRQEWLPLVNNKGEVIGKASREECHQNPELLHPVIRIHIFRSNGKLLIQQRSLKSDVEPGKWDAATAGHVQFGETAEQAVARELYEEVRMQHVTPSPISQRVLHFEKQSELVLLYYAVSDEKATVNKKEAEDIKEVELEELDQMKDSVTPAIIEEMNLLKKIRRTLKHV